jgi:hypothetical protein
MIVKNNALSFAVFAFAVGDMNARKSVMTTARPCAFLSPYVYNVFSTPYRLRDEACVLISSSEAIYWLMLISKFLSEWGCLFVAVERP